MNPKLLTLLLLSALIAACGRSGPEAASVTGSNAEAGHAAEDHAGEAAHIELSPEQIEAAGLGLAKAGPAQMRTTLPLYGVITPNAERMLEVTARFAGVIRTVNQRVGDPVRKGETLATVESNESLQTYPVIAPLTGVVTARAANPGEQTGERVLFTVADLSTVWVELSLFPRDVSRVEAGQTATIRSAEANLSAEGKVAYVSPIGSSASQTVTARVLLDNTARRWPPGLYVTADLAIAEFPASLAVRNEALQVIDGRSVVFVSGDDGFAPRPVRLGRTDGTLSEVLDGLQAGETYVTANSFILKSELGKGEAAHDH